jgi:hypothetical protein
MDNVAILRHNGFFVRAAFLGECDGDGIEVASLVIINSIAKPCPVKPLLIAFDFHEMPRKLRDLLAGGHKIARQTEQGIED